MTLLKILLTLFFNIAKAFLGLFHFDQLNSITETLSNYEIVLPSIVQFVVYFLDTRFFTILIPLEFNWIAFKLVIAILMRIKSFIPTISST